MYRKFFCFVSITILSIIVLVACAQPPQVASPLPADTQVLPQKTQPPPTLTPVPLTPTIESSPTESTLLVEPGRIVGMVDVGGRSLYLKCEGEGSPTVILVSDAKAEAYGWQKDQLFSRLAATTRTCIYDRANIGKSDPAPTPRTTQDMVNDLHALLVNAQVPGPYVMVGSNIGGWVTLLYAGQYPDEVVGMVLLDSLHPDQKLNISAAFPTAMPMNPLN